MTDLETWPSPENNKRVIGEKLVDAFATRRHILEIGSGTGQHAVWLAVRMPHLTWQTSDLQQNLEHIRQRLKVEGPDNVLQPLQLDVSDERWPEAQYDGIFCANSIHIMSWENVVLMFSGIGRVLEKGGRIVLYGPFKYGGEFTTPSNQNFDDWLKSRDAVSGIRDFEAVDELAAQIGLQLIADHPMPANNQLIVWGGTS